MLDVIKDMYKGYSIILTGCRALNLNYECCEYDIIILEDCKEEVIKIDDMYIEVHKLSNNKIDKVMQLYKAEIIQDPHLTLASLLKYLDMDMLKMHAKDLLIDAMLDASYAKNNLNALEGSFLLKRSAYKYLSAMLVFNKIKPSPLHILTQLRELDLDLTLPFECLGVKHANSSSIIRACNMLYQLTNSRLVSKKLLYLYERQKYVDCSLYLTYIGINQANYSKIIDKLRVLMNLNIDQGLIKQQSKLLLEECKSMLKKYFNNHTL
ncbi:MAG: hypothetical protein KatS3mg003_1547 [Candidatus Nitrosocaldaceae archaeon]|nr:MAG: hypothetical protein KatS3mg003_1547 [Candidatus Nitrosocaldaceae archaeon]